jgi:hypothetical protein
MKRQLKEEIASFGNTRTALLRARQRVAELRTQRDELQSECSALGAEVLAGSVDTGLSEEELQAAVALREEKVRLGVRESELRHRRTLLESETRGVREAIGETRREADEAAEQTKMLEAAVQDQKRKFALIENAEVAAPDVPVVVRCAAHGTLFDFRAALEQKRELLALMKRRKRNAKEKGATLVEQEAQIQEQIQSLGDLLASAKQAQTIGQS